MADQITVSDLIENEFGYKEAESYQDKIAKLETKVSQMEQEIDSLKEMIADLKKLSNKMSEGHSPIHTTAYSNHRSSAHHFPNMHSLSLKEAFNSLTEASKGRENSGRHFNVKTNQISFTNEHVLQPEADLVEMENENENLLNLIDFSIYDGMGNPLIHLKTYLDSLAGMEQGNKLKRRLFVRTLTGPALCVYPQFSNQVPPPSQTTVGPRFIAPNLSFYIAAASTCDIDGRSTKNNFIKKDHYAYGGTLPEN
ncbi:hypothetical protein HAX54_035071 [Datura stramonium]|uniref:Uncharacterized protein n=1 Tax=Datura stramonium TaxID=4076 RepID=A0ABS8VEV2_DATST|nr:hypothetical protein [Datura stramonium]